VSTVLPYAGTSGWSGSDTSKERALREDGEGTTGYRQSETLGVLWDAGYWGVTWSELAELYGWHHGQASGVLSVLHKAGKIVRLKARRNKSAIYVLPNYINDREVSERKVKTCGNCGHQL
jgi:hypothetical protein